MPQLSSRFTDESNFIIRGVHLDLPEAVRQAAQDKASRLFRHNDPIKRVRIDVEFHRNRGPADAFVAKGRLEMRGPDLVASAHGKGAGESIDLLVDTLDALLRTRRCLQQDRPFHLQPIGLAAAKA